MSSRYVCTPNPQFDNYPVRLAYNPYFTAKVPNNAPDKRLLYWKLNSSFINRVVPASTVPKIVQAGHPITCELLTGPDGKAMKRDTENFKCLQVPMLDFDLESWKTSIEALSLNPFIAHHAAFLYATANSTPDKPRTRVAFILERPIENFEQSSILMQALMYRFPLADASAKDPVRSHSGSKTGEMKILGNILTMDVVEKELIEPYLTWAAEEAKNRKQYDEDLPMPEIDRVKSALAAIPPDCEYYEWTKVMMAIHSVYPDDGMEWIEDWAPGYPGEVEEKWKSFDKKKGPKVNIGSLFYIAKKYGWKDPKFQGQPA